MGHLEVLGDNGEHGAPKDPRREGNWGRSQITEASFIRGQRGALKGHAQSRMSSDQGVSRDLSWCRRMGWRMGRPEGSGWPIREWALES